jgi:hypothetical protein
MAKLAKLEKITTQSWKVGGIASEIGEKGLIVSAENKALGGLDYANGFKNMEWGFNATKTTRPFEAVNRFGTPAVMVSGHVAAGAAAYIKDPDVSGAEAAIFSTIGAVVDSVLTYRSATQITGELQPVLKAASNAPDDETLRLAHSSLNKQISNNFTRRLLKHIETAPEPDSPKYKGARETPLSEDEIRFARLLEDMDEVTKSGRPTKRAERAIEELRKLGYKAFGTTEETKDFSKAADEFREAKRLERLEEFKDDAKADLQDRVRTSELTAEEKQLADALLVVDEVDSSGKPTKKALEANETLNKLGYKSLDNEEVMNKARKTEADRLAEKDAKFRE